MSAVHLPAPLPTAQHRVHGHRYGGHRHQVLRRRLQELAHAPHDVHQVGEDLTSAPFKTALEPL